MSGEEARKREGSEPNERERERKGDAKKEREKEREREIKGEKQEKQGRASLFRGGCCGINSVKSRRAIRVSETARDRGGGGEAN